MENSTRVTKILGVIIATGLVGTFATVSQASTWREDIAKTRVPHAGCFTAEYPSLRWKEVACVTAPNVPFIPRSGSGGGSETVGNGHDYAAEVSGTLISSALGSFPSVRVQTEEDGGTSNSYTLQANSNFMSGSPACNGAKNPSNCLAWEQFVYASNPYDEAFMQYWLINWDTTCPSGWNTYSGDCYKNSAAVGAGGQPIKQLKYLSLSGTAVPSGEDTLVFTTNTKAYSTTGEDSVTDLAGYWTGVEFNIVGNGGGSEAVFNQGTKITDKIQLVDGLTTAPTCASNAGTTGETNNLNLKPCTASGGTTPSISFVENLK